MNGVALAWFTTFVVALAVVLILLIAAVLLPRVGGLRTTSFYCPWAHRKVVVRYLTYDGRRPVGVVSCTAFADPRIVTCGMPCLSDEARGEPAPDDRDRAAVARDPVLPSAASGK